MVYTGIDRPSLQNSSAVPGPAASRPLPAGAPGGISFRSPTARCCPLSNRCS